MHKRLFALFASFAVTALVTMIGCDLGRPAPASSSPATATTTPHVAAAAAVDQVATSSR
jgi:hypothetical protein